MASVVVDQHGVSRSFICNGREGSAFLIRYVLDVGHEAGTVA